MNKSKIEFANEQSNKMSDLISRETICNEEDEVILMKDFAPSAYQYLFGYNKKFCPNCGARMDGEENDK